MPRPAKPHRVLNIKLSDRIYACLEALTWVFSCSKTAVVERLIDQEYRKWYGVLGRLCELSGEDISEYPLPLSGPTPAEEAQQIRQQEEILSQQIARVERRNERRMQRMAADDEMTRKITAEQWIYLLRKAKERYGEDAFSTLTAEHVIALLNED